MPMLSRSSVASTFSWWYFLKFYAIFLYVLNWEEGSGGSFEAALHLGSYGNVDKHKVFIGKLYTWKLDKALKCYPVPWLPCVGNNAYGYLLYPYVVQSGFCNSEVLGVNKTAVKQNCSRWNEANAHAGAVTVVREIEGQTVARNQYELRKFWNQPFGSKFSMIFCSKRENTELVAKFMIAFNASHAAIALLASVHPKYLST
jgi:hypothetical protein